MKTVPSTELPSQTPSTGDRPGAEIPFERFLDCVHCGLCTSACPTYLETGDENNSPRGRIYLMRAVTEGRIELTPSVSRHLDLCLDCRSCETACPSGVQYGRLIEPFRIDMRKAEMKQGAPSGSWLQRLILSHIFPYANRMRWALLPARLMQWLKLDVAAERLGLTRLLPVTLQRMQRLLPTLQGREPEIPHRLPAIGPKRATVALFTGCVADALFQQVNWATARVLQENGCEVIVPSQQACCGAIDYHSGQGTAALRKMLENAAAFDVQQVDAIIINVAGCGSMLKDYGHVGEELCADDPDRREQMNRFASKVKDIHEFLVQLGPVAPRGAVKQRVTYHDACHLCHAQQIRKQPRELLQSIPGLTLVPLTESEICCGAAGSYNLTEPEMSDRLGERKLHNLLQTDPQVVVSANAGCTLQIQALLKQAGRSDIEVLHPMELLSRSYQTNPEER
ncbi:(Fe-S)-binding protein [Planctomicrobium sp. SH664]|uniref:(Fe-S)-binding protein n=1 Tax=Planctomicrobium sp. SH664 TaxID=3448125 RepID=UPI003F5BC2C4